MTPSASLLPRLTTPVVSTVSPSVSVLVTTEGCRLARSTPSPISTLPSTGPPGLIWSAFVAVTLKLR